MLRSDLSSSIHTPAGIGGFSEATFGDPLLAFAGCVIDAHALVISRNGLDLMCRLLRHGCAATTILRPCEHCDHEAFDLVLVPNVGAGDAIDRLVRQARRALLPGGRFLAVAATGPVASDGDRSRRLLRAVRANGFGDIRTRTMQAGLLIRADVPKQARMAPLANRPGLHA